MPLKVAIVGFGFMGQMHARVYQSLPGVEIAALVDPLPAAADTAAQLGLACPIFPELLQVLDRADVDLIDICLPTDMHPVAITHAARSRKHIFCEKPLALSVELGEKALEEVNRAGVAFQVGHCIRFWPEYQALEQFVKSGAGGKLVSLALQRRASRPIYSFKNWLHNARRSGGAALDLHIHDTDFVHHLLGTPRAVHSVGRQQEGAWTRLFTHYLFDSVAVSAEGAWDLPPGWGFQMAFQAVFENAAIEYDSRTTPTLHLTLGESPRAPLPFSKPQLEASGPTTGNLSDLGGYYNELRYFCDCLREKRKPAIATGEQALESLRTVMAEIESLETGHIVTRS
jgi:predicted dehydrogenase